MEKKYKECPNCGFKNNVSASFCQSCGMSLKEGDVTGENTANQNKSNQGPTGMGGRGPMGMGTGMGGSNRWLFLLIPVIIILASYFLFNTGSSCASNLICEGSVVPLTTGYYTSYNLTVPSNSIGNIFGQFIANTTTTWVLGPATEVTNYLAGVGNLSIIGQYVIANSTTANLNINLTSGAYTIAFWGYNFSADTVTFPNGMNFTT